MNLGNGPDQKLKTFTEMKMLKQAGNTYYLFFLLTTTYNPGNSTLSKTFFVCVNQQETAVNQIDDVRRQLVKRPPILSTFEIVKSEMEFDEDDDIVIKDAKNDVKNPKNVKFDDNDEDNDDEVINDDVKIDVKNPKNLKNDENKDYKNFFRDTFKSNDNNDVKNDIKNAKIVKKVKSNFLTNFLEDTFKNVIDKNIDKNDDKNVNENDDSNDVDYDDIVQPPTKLVTEAAKAEKAEEGPPIWITMGENYSCLNVMLG